MKKFLLKIIVFCGIMAFIFAIGISLPTTPKAQRYVLFHKPIKDSLLKNVESPRIIFVGGSNLVYGLNSHMVKDSLGLNPINTGTIASVGLYYMMDNTLPYIRSNDIVILVPEYQHYFKKFAYGSSGLVRLLMDVDPSGFSHLNRDQWISFLKNLPDIFISKLDYNEYFNVKLDPAYHVDIFNEYGDSEAHWTMDKKEFEVSDFRNRKLNPAIIDQMKSFEHEIEKRGATLYVTYPCFQSKSFEMNQIDIERTNEILKKNSFKILGSPERYRMADSLMFDTPYHLIKFGVDLRTELLIEDLKRADVKSEK